MTSGTPSGKNKTKKVCLRYRTPMILLPIKKATEKYKVIIK